MAQRSLPTGWYWTTMGEIADVVGGGTPRTNDPANFENGDIPWITPADLSGYTAKYISHGARFITRKGLETSSARVLPAGAVLFTSRAPIGYVALARNPVATNQGFKSFVLKDGLLPEYVYWWLKGSKQRAESLASGTTFLELSGANAKKIPIPIAPLEQQREIVAELEKQFSRLDEAVANLKRVKANLKRYKAAVLQAAVEGRLVPTEDELARREGRAYESGHDLLQRILTARRSQWNGKGSYKDPAAPVSGGLPDVPAGWAASSLEAITSATRVICYGILMPKENVPNGVLYVKVRNMRADAVVLATLERTSHQIAEKYARASLRTGDLLLSIRGTYGRVATVPPELNGGNITQDTARLEVSRLLMTEFVAAFLRSESAQRYYNQVARGVAVKGVNIRDIRPMVIPIPPFIEQRRIVDEIERRLSIVREVEAEADANLERAQGLRQVTLSQTFAATTEARQ
jgi:type I restriction enzyme S subunit